MTYQLYAAPLSLYSGKARGYLRWKNVPYREVQANRTAYAEVIRRVGYPIVPVLVTPEDKTVQDTSDIIDYIEANEPGPSCYPDGPRQKLAALIMETYGDEFLVIAAMHYRWAYNKEYAWGEFGKALFPELPQDEQFKAGEQAAQKFMGFLPMLGISEKSKPAIEETYEDFLRAFDKHLEHHDFLLGSRPSIGDYGLLGPLYAHNLRDPESGKHMRRVAPRVADWALRCHAPQHPLMGEFLPDDDIPETLIDILKLFARDQLPILISTAKHLTEWAKGQEAGAEVPRAIGIHEFTLAGVTENRAIIPFNLWMVQRPLDYLRGLSGEDRQSAESLLTDIGAEDFAALRFPRLTRKDFKLVLE